MPITPDELDQVLETVKVLREQLEGLKAQAELDTRRGAAGALPAPRLDRIP